MFGSKSAEQTTNSHPQGNGDFSVEQPIQPSAVINYDVNLLLQLSGDRLASALASIEIQNICCDGIIAVVDYIQNKGTEEDLATFDQALADYAASLEEDYCFHIDCLDEAYLEMLTLTKSVLLKRRSNSSVKKMAQRFAVNIQNS